MNTLREFLKELDFDYKLVDGNKIKLIDLQKGNLGNIEEETFDNIDEVIQRLEMYVDDYFIKDLEDIVGEVFYYMTYKDILNYINEFAKKDN